MQSKKQKETNLVLKSIKVGLSISDSPDLMSHGISNMHLDDAMVEFSRYLLVSGAKLMYGGRLKTRRIYRNFT